MTHKFPEIFKSITVIIECNVVSVKGFEKSAYASFPLAMRAAASSSVALANFQTSTVTTETAALQATTTLQSIAANLGSLQPVNTQAFAPTVQAEVCSSAMCSFNGQCFYQPFQKLYYCNCTAPYAGRNCSF